MKQKKRKRKRTMRKRKRRRGIGTGSDIYEAGVDVTGQIGQPVVVTLSR
jgi:hypothetical protein